MKETLMSRLLYNGLPKETYTKYKDFVLKSDAKNLTMYLRVCSVAFLCLGIISAIGSNFTRINTLIYMVTALACMILLITQGGVKKLRGETSRWQVVLIYLTMAVIYAESIIVTLLHTSAPAVTYIGVLLMMPLLFSQSAVYTLLLQILSTLAFSILVSRYKPPEVAEIDVWNGITFFAVSLLTIFLVSPIRAKTLIQTEVIRELSEKDMLTSVRNRNSYEVYCAGASRLKVLPVCVYADVNGLHELNNAKGHEAGDEMLKTVAAMLCRSFGEEHTYRLGGDEFLSFSFAHTYGTAEKELARLEEELRASGYHVSFGLSAPQDGEEDDIASLVKRAEQQMYDRKKAYYETVQPGRRPRR